MELKDLLTLKMVEYYIKNNIRENGTCPAYADMASMQNERLNNIFSVSSIPSIEFGSDCNIENYKRVMDDIRILLSSVSGTIAHIVQEHKKLSALYQDICVRIDNESVIFKQMINSILSYSCFFVDTSPVNQMEASLVGKIGKFVTLPFFMSAVKMYNGSVYMRPISSGDISFSNLEAIQQLPFSDWPSLKISSAVSTIEITLNASINKITANAIYLNFLNSLQECTITLYNGNSLVYKDTASSSEILFNFEPVEFDAVSIRLECNNVNTSKPFAMQLRSFEIFEKIQFAKNGAFQAKPIYLEEASRIGYVGVQYTDSGNTQKVSTQPLISVSTTEENMAYNIIDPTEFTDISYLKYKHSKEIGNFVNLDREEGAPDYITTQALGADDYYKVPVLPGDPTWDMNYRYASVFHGLNSEYAKDTTDLVYYSMFENWTLVGNYYKTMLLNYEDNIFVDIGQKTCIFNGRQLTGRIRIPIGISTIEVHAKDIDFKFGNKIADYRYNGIAKKDAVYGDDLFPFNFAYMFAGMPDYEDSTNDMSPVVVKVVNISTPTTIFLDEPFIPLSISVTGTSGAPLKMQLTRGVSAPNTFSIEPHSGKVRIYVESETLITIRYRRASLTRRPCGILFNRLLTFIPLKALIGLPDKDDTLFTIDGTPTERYLLIKKISNVDIQHSYLMFNKFTDKIYSSIKIDMRTNNQYLSPIISDVFITTG